MALQGRKTRGSPRAQPPASSLLQRPPPAVSWLRVVHPEPRARCVAQLALALLLPAEQEPRRDLLRIGPAVDDLDHLNLVWQVVPDVVVPGDDAARPNLLRPFGYVVGARLEAVVPVDVDEVE